MARQANQGTGERNSLLVPHQITAWIVLSVRRKRREGLTVRSNVPCPIPNGGAEWGVGLLSHPQSLAFFANSFETPKTGFCQPCQLHGRFLFRSSDVEEKGGSQIIQLVSCNEDGTDDTDALTATGGRAGIVVFFFLGATFVEMWNGPK